MSRDDFDFHRVCPRCLHQWRSYNDWVLETFDAGTELNSHGDQKLIREHTDCGGQMYNTHSIRIDHDDGTKVRYQRTAGKLEKQLKIGSDQGEDDSGQKQDRRKVVKIGPRTAQGTVGRKTSTA